MIKGYRRLLLRLEPHQGCAADFSGKSNGIKCERTVAVLLALAATLSACSGAQDRPSSSTSS